MSVGAPVHTTPVFKVLDNPDLEPPMDMQMSGKDYISSDYMSNCQPWPGR